MRRKWLVVFLLLTFLLLVQSPSSSATHETHSKTRLRNQHFQDAKRVDEAGMLDNLTSFKHRKFGVQVKKGFGVRPRARAKTSAAVRSRISLLDLFFVGGSSLLVAFFMF